MYYHTFESIWGPIILVGDEQGITQLLIDNGTKPIVIEKYWQKNDVLFSEAQKQLDAYALGERKEFDLKINPKGTDYQKAVWKTLVNIPHGETRTYKEIAISMGNPNASRAVGLANNKNPIPILIPCHRVLGAKGQLVGFAYGLDLKRELLLLENPLTGLFSK